MDGVTFERLRGPLAIVLLAVALVVLWPRGGEAGTGEPDGESTPGPSIVVGEIGGAILATPTPSPSPTSTPSPSPTPTATPVPLPDTFSAEVLACRDVDGDRCRGEFHEFPRRRNSFTALVRFEDARAGDTISVTLSGAVTINGGPFTLQGGGDGYYYARITYGDLPDGDYALIALRNGAEVARITLRND